MGTVHKAESKCLLGNIMLVLADDVRVLKTEGLR